MKILLVAATEAEILPTLEFLAALGEKSNIVSLITGVGSMQTAYHFARYLALNPDTDLAINAGIAGTFCADWALGTVLQVESDCQADLGVELNDGGFSSMFDLGLAKADAFPYQAGQLKIPAAQIGAFLPTATAITVNKVHGYAPSIEKIKQIYPTAELETMEGAAFFYAALQQQAAKPDFRFMAIRAISNYVAPRNRETWDIPLAVANLNEVLMNILGALAEE
jgi:futalosine hydrolase